jgi:signal transduction histidine kinase
MDKRRDIAEEADLSYDKARIEALNRYKIYGTLSEEIFDHYVQMASLIFKIPAAVIAFVGEDGVESKAHIGIGGIKNGSQHEVICTETIKCGNDILIADLTKTSYGSGPESVYTYYAGAPIFTHDGYAIGCLGLLDHKIHHLSAEQKTVLKILASAVMDAVEERLKNLQEVERNQWFSKTAHEGMWEWDIRQDKIWWNTNFCIIFGYDLASTMHHDLDFWCSRFDAENYAEIENAMHAHNLNGEYLFKKADNTMARALIRSVLIKDEFDQPVKMVGSILDISERYKNEEITREVNMEMMRNKDEFISITSHEIKTPITIIKSYSQLIRREVDKDGQGSTKIDVYAERIQKQSEKLLKLVENLLDISSISSGKMNIYPEMFDFTQLLEQTIDELDTGNITHVIEKNGDTTLHVFADKFRIGQVLTNLITNAIKYSPGADKVIIDHYKNVNGNTGTISVRDFGVGIAGEDQVKLFQKFYRILNLQESRISGTGLGLSIAMEIVKEHGSIIKLYSEVGKGSVFSFDLLLSPIFNPNE